MELQHISPELVDLSETFIGLHTDDTGQICMKILTDLFLEFCIEKSLGIFVSFRLFIISY